MKLIYRFSMAAVLAVATLGSAPACSSGGDRATVPTVSGSLTMALVGSTAGTTYRLRNALFDITGASSTTLDSETAPNASSLSVSLAVGNYQVLLQPGWALERLDAMGGAVPVQASLVSANPVDVEIIAGSTTTTVFRFMTDGTIVDIGVGDLQISIAVDVAADGGAAQACDLLAPVTSCTDPTQACYVSSSGPQCAPAGTLAEGAACTYANECSPGGICVDLGSGPVCTALCDASVGVCANGDTCADLGLGGAGVCISGSSGGGGGGGTTTGCTYSVPTGCAAGETCLPTDNTGATQCYPAGSVPTGAVCDANLQDCVEGDVCLDDGTQTTCYVICSLSAPQCPGGQICLDAGIPDFGVCQ